MPGRWLTSILARVREPIKRLNRTVGIVVACALLLTVGGLALLAHSGNGAGGRSGGGLLSNVTGTATDSTPDATMALTGNPTHAQDATPHSTPTSTVYTGPNYMRVSYNTSSCHPGAVSPYPYLNVEDTSQNTPLY